MKSDAFPRQFTWKRSSPTKRRHTCGIKRNLPEKLPLPTHRPWKLGSPFGLNTYSSTELSEGTGSSVKVTEQCLSKFKELNPTEINLKEALKHVRILELKCASLQNNVSELMDEFEVLQSSVFYLERFSQSDDQILFYTGFPNYRTCFGNFRLSGPRNYRGEHKILAAK